MGIHGYEKYKNSELNHSQELDDVHLNGNNLKQLPLNLLTYNKKLYRVDVSDNELEKTDRNGLRAKLDVSHDVTVEQ
uniref:Leucine-rich repeat domain-containing protein n=1 Tax=Panagrellus redivivus TaxID=6233 RepID=A0A7E4V3K0_PANRE